MIQAQKLQVLGNTDVRLEPKLRYLKVLFRGIRVGLALDLVHVDLLASTTGTS